MTTRAFAIPRIESGATSEEEALQRFNAPIDHIEAALDGLAGRMDSIGSKCSLIYEHAPLSAECTAGTLVYYRPADNDNPRGEFMPAQAMLLPDPGEQGQSVEAACSRVVGMVIRLDANTGPLHGAILCGGYWEDLDNNKSVINACLGSDALPGTYYLSPTAAGKAVPAELTSGHLQQGVLTYMGDGKLCFGLHYLAHDNHWHGSSVLPRDGWVATATRLPTGVSSEPAGYVWWYDVDALNEGVSQDSAYDALNSAVRTLGELSPRTTAVFYNGLLVPQDDTFTVYMGYLWYRGETAPDNGSVVVFNSYPFAYNSPLVRAIVSENDALTVSNRNGTISLRQNDFRQGGTEYKATAMYSIAGKVITNTHVVSKIEGGPGISVNDRVGGGIVRLSLSDMVGSSLHDAYAIDHNGTNQANDGIYPYIMFPAGRSSSLTITLPVTGIDAGTRLAVRVWMMGMTYGAYQISTRFVAQPTAAGSVDVSGIQPVTGELSGGETGKLVYMETPRPLTITGPGTLVSSIRTVSVPTTDRKVLRLGYRLEFVDIENATDGDSGDMVAVSALINRAVAYDTIVACTAIRVAEYASGKVAPCTSGKAENANECIGIAINNASEGATVEYVSGGVLDLPGYNLEVGSALYIGPNGALVITDPAEDASAKFIQRVGTAITPSSMQVNIEQAIIK